MRADEPSYTLLSFDDLNGWAADDMSAALVAFNGTCDLIEGAEWPQLCALAKTGIEARAFFELFFRPVLIEDGTPMLFTGYFEPELDGSRFRTERFRYPLYRKPADLGTRDGYFTRREIEAGALAGRGLELVWVDDPVELFFLQVQGSGRIRFADGSGMRVGYAAANGHPYRSIGQELVRRGVFDIHQVSAQVIRTWVRNNPYEGAELLRSSPSFVFFREYRNLGSATGPIGAMNRPVSAMRTVAVDPAYTPLGAPVWIEKSGGLNRLMVAQDKGSAIKGAQRADIFFGSGDAAGEAAGTIKDGGRMVVLLPIQTAYALCEDVSG
nr:MltA domain-containing protein [Aquimixticola soesokkakensis]